MDLLSQILALSSSLVAWSAGEEPQLDPCTRVRRNIQLTRLPVLNLFSEYPWAELGEATIVDVGGGEGKHAQEAHS